MSKISVSLGCGYLFGTIFAIIVSVGLPILAFIYGLKKKMYIPFLLGVLAFVVSQMLLRLPLLEFLQKNSTDFIFFSMTQPVLFAILLGLSAGVFEETARFIAMRYIMKQRDWLSGFLFGTGHGGIEAVIFVGIPAFQYVFSPFAITFGDQFFIGGIERFFAIILHIGLSIIVLQAVVHKKIYYLLVAILIHTLVNASIGIIPLFISGGQVVIVLEIVIAIVALAVLLYTLWIKRKGVLQ